MKKTIPSLLAMAITLFAGVAARAENHPAGVALKSEAGRPNSKAVHGSGLVVTGVSVGSDDFFPCYNCAGFGSVAIPYELAAVVKGAGIISSIQMQPTVYVGYPTVKYSLVQGGKVLSSSSLTFPFLLYPGLEALAYFPDTVSGITGDAEVRMQLLDSGIVLSNHTYRIYIE